MKFHPRRDLTTNAEIDMKKSVCATVTRHPGITHAELQHIFLSIALSWNKYAIRDEREEYPRVQKDDPDYERLQKIMDSGQWVCDSIDHNLERGCSNPQCFKHVKREKTGAHGDSEE